MTSPFFGPSTGIQSRIAALQAQSSPDKHYSSITADEIDALKDLQRSVMEFYRTAGIGCTGECAEMKRVLSSKSFRAALLKHYTKHPDKQRILQARKDVSTLNKAAIASSSAITRQMKPLVEKFDAMMQELIDQPTVIGLDKARLVFEKEIVPMINESVESGEIQQTLFPIMTRAAQAVDHTPGQKTPYSRICTRLKNYTEKHPAKNADGTSATLRDPVNHIYKRAAQLGLLLRDMQKYAATIRVDDGPRKLLANAHEKVAEQGAALNEALLA